MSATRQQPLFDLAQAYSNAPRPRRTRREAEQARLDQHARYERMKAADAERELTIKVFAVLLGSDGGEP